MTKKRIIIILSLVLIALSIYSYTVIRSYNEKVVEENMLKFLEKRNDEFYPDNLIAKMEIIEKRVIGYKTFFIVHQEYNNSILIESYNYPITDGMRLDEYIMIEKIDRFLSYPEYRERAKVLINNKQLDRCDNFNGICDISGYYNDWVIEGINATNASKIKLIFKNQPSIIIDVKDKLYILEIVKMEYGFEPLLKVELFYE